LLETDPRAALTPKVKEDFGIRDDAKLFDIDDPTYSGGTDESGAEPKFNESKQEQLDTVIQDGTLPDRRTAKMVPSEWVSYPPLYTRSLEHPDDGSTLSLLEWAKILAYLYRFKFVNEQRFPAFKDMYETDPAAAVHTIVNGGTVRGNSVLVRAIGEFSVKGLPEVGTKIKYAHGEKALFRLGDPPNPKLKLVNLQEVLDNPNGYARVMVRICC
jgi:hypothetical protein